jgi:hypothetical protein
MELIVIFYVFLTGMLTKFADIIADDGLEIKWVFSYATGIVYGILIAYIISTHPLLAPMAMAAVLAVLLTKKIDMRPHNIGIASMFFFLALWGFPSINISMMAAFLIAGVIDELGNDRADQGKLKGSAKKIFEHRLIFDITAFFVSYLTGEWIIFFSSLSFEAGYETTEMIGKKFG